MPFVSNPKRDASASIAGIVYQVDVTIVRWLSLRTNELLELERGEDIDVVREGAPNSAVRTLEQVKRRSPKLTLRSADALSALACFCEHRQVNPDQRLRFKFITTSELGEEQHWPLGGSAIEFWQSLRAGDLTDPELTEALSAIRRFLMTCEKPSKLNASTWAYLQLAIAENNGKELVGVIQSFEWSVQARDYEGIEADIKRGLVDSGHAADAGSAETLFERLFLYVFKRLCQDGLKRLTPEELSEQLKLPNLSVSDEAVLGIVREFRGRLLELEQQVVRDNAVLKALSSQVTGLITSFGSSFRYVQPIPSLDAPVLVDPAIPRSAVVAVVMGELSTGRWVSIVGEPGCGKTQLCLLVAERPGSRALWINLRGQEQSWAAINAALQGASGVPFHPLLREWYRDVTQRLPPETIIVIDDLPRILPGSPLDRQLEFLRNACRNRGLRVMSTTYHDLPAVLAASGEVAEVRVPRLTTAEIVELLRSYGAPATIVGNATLADLLVTATQGLPVLVVAVASFLKSVDWSVDWPSFSSVMTGGFASDLKRDMKGVIENTVNRPDTRELLYRLSCVVGPITPDQVEAICRVPLPIQLGLEKLSELRGVWIQPYSSSTYLVSPLVDKSVGDYLDPTTRRGVHGILGALILKRKTLAPVDVVTCIYHFQQASMVNQAAVMLIQALMFASELETEAQGEWMIASIWANSELPAEIDINLRLALRAAQIRLADARGKDQTFLLTDLENLIGASRGAPIAQAGLFMANSLLALQFVRSEPDRANRYIIETLKSLELAAFPDGTKMPVPPGMAFESLLWATAIAPKSTTEIDSWFNAVEQLTPSQRANLVSSDLADENSIVLCDSIWYSEYRKPEGERDWHAVENVLIHIEQRAKDLGLPILRAAAIRTRIVVVAEWYRDIGQAKTLAEAGLSWAVRDEERFLITEVMGRQLAYAGRLSEGLAWIERALEFKVREYAFLRRNLLITAAEGVGGFAPAMASGYTADAVEVTKAAALNPARVAEALGEHCIALWNSGQANKAFSAWEEAICFLTQAREDNTPWLQTFLAFHHAAGYFSSLAVSGKPPRLDYVPANQGFFLGTADIAVTLYKPILDSLLLVRTAMFAEGVGATATAGRWAEKGLKHTGQLGADLFSVSGWLLIAPAILKSDYGEAIQAAYQMETTAGNPSTLQELGIDPQDTKMQQLQTPGRLRTNYSLLLSVVPIAFRLATLKFEANIDADIEMVASTLERISTEQKGEWKEAASVVQLIFSSEPSWRDLYGAGQRYYGENRTSLGILCFLGALVRAPLLQSLTFQLRMAADLQKLFACQPSIRLKVIMPFFERFWADAVATGSANFRTAAAYTERSYREAVGASVKVRLKKLLSSMVFCTGLSVQHDLRQWLDSG
jgi:hypothetical protein